MLGLFPLLFVRPMIHGGTLLGYVLAESSLVLGGYCTLELVRCATPRWNRYIWGIWLVPYVLLIGYALYYAIPNVPRIFAI